MQLTIADIKVWNESLIGLIKELENLLNFKTKAQDPTLKSIFGEQLVRHQKNYRNLQSLLQDGLKTEMTETIKSYRYPDLSTANSPKAPHLVLEGDSQKSGDRLLAYSHFLACCRGGREFSWNLFDVSYPPLAEILQHAISQYAVDAVTMKLWLLDHGHYLTEWATPEQVRSLQTTFE